MEQKDHTNEDADVNMSTNEVQDQEQVVQPPTQSVEPSTTAAATAATTTPDDATEMEVVNTGSENDSAVAVIDTAAMEKTWEEELNNLVKRLKNDRPPNRALDETLEILLEEFESHNNTKPLNIKEELTNRLRPRGLFIIKQGYLKRISDAILDRGNLDSEGYDLTLQVAFQVLDTCSTFILDTDYVSILGEAVHSLLNPQTTFNSRYGRQNQNATPVHNFSNHFKSSNGYDRLYHRTKDKRRMLSISDLRWAFTIICDFPGNRSDVRSSASLILENVEQRILAITPEDLRTEPRGTSPELLRLLGSVFRRPATGSGADTADAGSEADDNAYKMYFRCSLHLAALLVDFAGMFEKKHAGLREICAWIHDNTFPQEVARWIHEEHIIQKLLHDTSVHAEFVRKSQDLLALEAQHGYLDSEEIDLIWRFCTATTAEENRSIMLDNVAKVSVKFMPSVFSAFEERFSSLPDDTFFGDVAMFDAICYFASNELNADGLSARKRAFYEQRRNDMLEQKKDTAELMEKLNANLAAAAFDVKPCCLERMWAGMLDGSAAISTAAAETRIVNGISNVFKFANSVRPELYERYQDIAVENVKAHKSVWQSLHFLVYSLPDVNIQFSLKALDTKYQILSAFIEECPLFRRDAVAANISDDSGIIPGTRVPYSDQVRERFMFANFLLSKSKAISLGKHEVGMLWELFVTKALTRTDTTTVLQFFSTIAQESGEVFDKETSRFLFPGMAETFNFRSIGDAEYEFVSYFFMFSNWKEGFYNTEGNKWVIKNYPSLVGIDVLWRIALETEDENVGNKAIDAIFGYFSSLSSEEAPNSMQYKECALKRCVDVLSEEASKPADAVYDVRVVRALTFVRMVLEGFEIQNPHKSLLTSKAIRSRTAAKVPSSPAKPTQAVSLEATKALVAAPGEETVSVSILLVGNSEPYVFKDIPKSAKLGDVVERLIREHPNIKPNGRIVTSGKGYTYEKTLADILDSIGKRDSAELKVFYVQRQGTATQAATSVPKAAQKPNLPETSVVFQASTYEALGRLLALPGIASGVCLRVLGLLPTDPSLLHTLDAAYSEGDSAAAVEWSSIITSGRRLLYALPILAEYLDVVYPKKTTNAEQSEESPDHKTVVWRNAFIGGGGLACLVRTFNEMDYAAIHAKDASEKSDKMYKSFKFDKGSGANRAKWCHILHDTVRIIAWCITTQETAAAATEAIFTGKDDGNGIGKAFLEHLFRTTSALVGSSKTHDFDSTFSNNTLFRSCVEILTTLVRWPSGNAVEAAVSAYIACSRATISAWIRTSLVDCECSSYRISAETLVLALAERNRDGGNESKMVTQYLLELLPEVSTSAAAAATTTTAAEDDWDDLTSKGENYFNILNKLLSKDMSSDGTEMEVVGEDSLIDLFVQVTSYIKARPVKERNFGKGELGGDSVLQGLLRLAVMLAPRIGSDEGSNKARCELFAEVFRNCLFAAPSADARDHVPKCKKEKSRLIAYDLLRALSCAGLTKGFVEDRIAKELWEKIDVLDAQDLPKGAFFADNAVRPARSYSGLYNQGATCYMNSTLQQFFMVPEFRRALMEIDIKLLDEKKANVPFFKAIQKLFLAMQESQHIAQRTKKFTNTLGPDFKSYIQMDANEFLGNFIGTIENGVKGTPYKNITDIFTAKLCDEMIPRGCSHVRENVSLSTTIEVDVKGKRSLEESLESWVRGELLEGDNKCTCEACGEKRDTLKRPCFLETPPVLILHLRRFEFSYETFTNFKVNDEFHFPLNFSLRPYTKKGLHEKEDADKSTNNAATVNNVNSVDSVDDDEYELIGVVTHRGTTNSGHYYSFIKEHTEEGRWFEFNDSTVSSFNTDNIANECFGGNEPGVNGNASSSTTSQKTNNGYILFYKKKSWDSSEKHAREGGAESLSENAKKKYSKIWHGNESFITGIDMCDSSFVDFVKRTFVDANIVNSYAIGVVQKTLIDLMAHIPNEIPSGVSKKTTMMQNDDKDFMTNINAMDVEGDSSKENKGAPADVGAHSPTNDGATKSNYDVFLNYLKSAYADKCYAEELILSFFEDDDCNCLDYYAISYILESTNQNVRKAFAEIVYTALLTLINSDVSDYHMLAGRFIYRYICLMDDDYVEKNWKTFDEYFYLISLIAGSAEYRDDETKRQVLCVMERADLPLNLASICVNDKEVQESENLKVTKKMHDKYSSVVVTPVAAAAAVYLRESRALGVETKGPRFFGAPSIYNALFTGEQCFSEAAEIADCLCCDDAEVTKKFVTGTLREAFMDYFKANGNNKEDIVKDNFSKVFGAFRTGFLLAPGRSDCALSLRGELFASALIDNVLEMLDNRDVFEGFLCASDEVLISVPGVRKAFVDNADKCVLPFLFQVLRKRCRQEGYTLFMDALQAQEKDFATKYPLISGGEQEGGDDDTKAHVCKMFNTVFGKVATVESSLNAIGNASNRPVRTVPIAKLLYQTLRYEDQAKALFASEHYKSLIELLGHLNKYNVVEADAKYYIVKLLHEALVAVPDATAEDIRLADIKDIVNSWSVCYPPYKYEGVANSADSYASDIANVCTMLKVLFDFVHLLDTRFGPEPVLSVTATSSSGGAFEEFCENILFNPDYAPVKKSFSRLLPTAERAPEEYKVLTERLVSACLGARASVPVDTALDILEDPAVFGGVITRSRDLATFFIRNFDPNRRNVRFLGFVKRVLDAEESIEEYESLATKVVEAATSAGLEDDKDSEVIERLKGVWTTFVAKYPECPIPEIVYSSSRKFNGPNGALLGVICDTLVDTIQKEASEGGDGDDFMDTIEAATKALSWLSVAIGTEKYVDVLTTDVCIQALRSAEIGIDWLKRLCANYAMFNKMNLNGCKVFNLVIDTAFDFGRGDERLGLKRDIEIICNHIDVVRSAQGLAGWLERVKLVPCSSKTVALLFRELNPNFMESMLNYLERLSKVDSTKSAALSILRTLDEYGIGYTDNDNDDDDDEDSDKGMEVVSDSDSDTEDDEECD